MWVSIKRLSFGLFLIAAASAVLLATDGRRSDTKGVPQIALLQYAENPVYDDSIRGFFEGLSAAGYRDGETIHVVRYNAHGEMATCNDIARVTTTGPFDLVVSLGTPTLQAVANANKSARKVHVFGLTADPFHAGVGLNPDDPLDHPPYMVGHALVFPVSECFRMARQMNPSLKTIGVPWNPAESNSVYFVEAARKDCRELGLTLLEAQVESTSGVREAVQSLIARGIEAVWVGGDNTVVSAMDTVVLTARQGHVPVFSITPNPKSGTLFDLGFDYTDAGRLSGELVAEVLKGADPAKIPIRNAASQVRRRLIINLTALPGLRGPWKIPDDLLQKADVVVDDKGVHPRSHKAP